MGLFFWPLMIISLILAILALGSNKVKLLYISSILLLPLSLYLAATPRFEVWGVIFPLFYVGSAVSLAKKRLGLAIVLVIPNFLLIGWLGLSVLLQ